MYHSYCTTLHCSGYNTYITNGLGIHLSATRGAIKQACFCQLRFNMAGNAVRVSSQRATQSEGHILQMFTLDAEREFPVYDRCVAFHGRPCFFFFFV